MPKRWSKLKRRIESFFDQRLDLKVYCTDMNKGIGRRDWNNAQSLSFMKLGSFRFDLAKETIRHFPKDFVTADRATWPNGRPYSYSASDISRLLQAYMETPKESVLGKEFENDLFHVTDVMKAADRRFSAKTLAEHFRDTDHEFVQKILEARTP